VQEREDSRRLVDHERRQPPRSGDAHAGKALKEQHGSMQATASGP
jgi:hypothetical protein